MTKHQSKQRSEERKSSSPLFVPTYRSWPAWERGLFILGPIGISYVPIARTWVGTVCLILIILWYIFFGLLAVLGGGFKGFWWLPWNLAGVFILTVLTLPFSSRVRKKARAQERLVKTGGLKAVQAVGEVWHMSWDEVDSFGVGSRPKFNIQVIPVNGKVKKFQLLGKESSLDFIDRSHTATIVSKVVNQYASSKMKYF